MAASSVAKIRARKVVYWALLATFSGVLSGVIIHSAVYGSRVSEINLSHAQYAQRGVSRPVPLPATARNISYVWSIRGGAIFLQFQLEQSQLEAWVRTKRPGTLRRAHTGWMPTIVAERTIVNGNVQEGFLYEGQGASPPGTVYILNQVFYDPKSESTLAEFFVPDP